MGRLKKIEDAIAALGNFTVVDGSITNPKIAGQAVSSDKLNLTLQGIINAVNRIRWRDDLQRFQIDGGGNNAGVSYADSAGHAGSANSADRAASAAEADHASTASSAGFASIAVSAQQWHPAVFDTGTKSGQQIIDSWAGILPNGSSSCMISGSLVTTSTSGGHSNSSLLILQYAYRNGTQYRVKGVQINWSDTGSSSYPISADWIINPATAYNTTLFY